MSASRQSPPGESAVVVHRPKKALRTPSSRAAEQLGVRIRQARRELGMTLSTLAGSDLSRAFVNQIELGRARPSMRTLQIIAARLERPIEYFLQGPEVTTTAIELALTEAEMRVRKDPERARSLMTELLARKEIPLEARVRGQLILGYALMRSGMAQESIPVLEQAIAVADRRGWPALRVELYDRMGSARYVLRQWFEAGRWWERALAAYQDADLKEPLLKARVLGHQANLHYVNGHARQAIVAYQSAITAAEDVLDMQSLAGIYEGLAMSYQQAGLADRALAYAQRSLRIFEAMRDVRMSAQLRNNMADILLQEGQAKDAERLFLEGVNQLRQLGDHDLMPILLAGAAEAALEQGDLDRSQIWLDAASAAAPRSTDPISSVAVTRVGGRVAFARGDLDGARSRFDQATAAASALESPAHASRVAYDYARMLEASGDLLNAALRYREAYERRRSVSEL